MVSEAGDVQSFLAQHPPFDLLSESQLEFASANILVAFNKSGSELTAGNNAEATPAIGMLIVRSGSIEVRDGHGVLVDRLSSGDYLVPELLYNGTLVDPRVSVLEDCLYYELTSSALRSLRHNSKEIAALFDAEPLRITATDVSANSSSDPLALLHATRDAYLNQHVEVAMSADMVCADPKTDIRSAAQLMKRKRVSSLLIIEHEQLVGIITDRDFRVRVLAEGVADTRPIAEVMTRAPMCIDASQRLYDAQLTMMSEGIHHLPVTKHERPAGIITLSDILRANNAEPLSLVQTINRASTVEELGAASQGLPALIVKLVERDTRAVEVGKIITSLSDAITRRLLKLAETQFGSPPCDYAWLAFGSQARQEQVLGSDQDNALLLPDNISADDAGYFKAFSSFVNDGLNVCGMPYCPGDIMASNAKWRLSLADWKACFRQWIEAPSPKALMHASIFFDMRHIAGNASLTDALHAYVLERAQTNTIFLALMCDNALINSPPLGFFKTFVLETDGDHNHTLDLKKRGTIPIVDVARNFTLSAGLSQLNTLERLQAIEHAGVMSRELSLSLLDAHEFIAGLRLKDQGKKYRANQAVDNYLDPKALSPLVRHQLKDAFAVVREGQAAMKMRFGGGVL